MRQNRDCKWLAVASGNLDQLPEKAPEAVFLWPLASQQDTRDFQDLIFYKNSGQLDRGTWIIPGDVIGDGDNDVVNARFDSNVYLYDFVCETSSIFANLSEVFSIKGRHHFRNAIGQWTPGKGVNIVTPHIWERRQGFLKGVKITGVYLDFAAFNYVEIINGTNWTYGIIPDVINLLQVRG